MREGTSRADVVYVWPRTLRLPDCPPMLVYLDLNHWISLAKAVSGHPDGNRHIDMLNACLAAVDEGRAVFPISDTIYFEVSKIGLYRQRRDLREAIELVSRYMVVTSRSVVAAHEVEALLDSLIGPNPKPINTMHYLDWGVARALGLVGGFRVKSEDGKDVTAEVRASHPDGPEAFDTMMADAELELNRRVLDGPTRHEEPKLRELGWDPTGAFEVAKTRAAQEIEQVNRFNRDPTWRRGRIRDAMSVREVVIELNDILSRGLNERRVTFDKLFTQVMEIAASWMRCPASTYQ